MPYPSTLTLSFVVGVGLSNVFCIIIGFMIMCFLIPIPFAQILGMIAGALVGAAPGAKKSIEKLIKTLAKLSKNK